MTILRAKNIHRSYTDTIDRVDVLKGIDCEIREGETIAIVGPSGAGKSTFLHILGGLDEPDQGKVFLKDRDMYALCDGDRAAIRNREFGFVFQFYHLLPEFHALHNVILPAFIQKNSCRIKELEGLGRAALEQVGLKDRLHHKPNQLSGGEQQRVAIARALVNKPEIVFCDEPTGNLDSHAGDAIIDLLLALNDKTKQTIIIVTHDEHVAARCRRKIHIKDGILET
ncbi:MAG: ABC transporter ATP-binding protein [Candidatus Omnitrophica bacterium]|nr:ABC transporter ATP-binding protein [Candidatus Omnitrophota bacterium]